MPSPFRPLIDTVRTAASRCVSLARGKALDADLDEELSSHIDHAVDEHVAAGMTRPQARTAALRRFGGLTQTRETYRNRRGLPFLEQAARDFRFAIRQLFRAPGFTLTAILTLALGLGANTAVFSVINGLLLRPLPVPHAEELAVLSYLRSDAPEPDYSFSAPMLRALERRHDVFQSVGAYDNSILQVRGSAGNVEITGSLVSGGYFQTLETAPLMGRYLTPADDQPGGATSGYGAVITEDFWHNWFNGAPDIVGRKLVIANTPFTVVGVMPRSFIGANPTRRPEIYLPLWAEPITDAPYSSVASGYHSWFLRVVGRRKPGVSLEQANAALETEANGILDETAPEDPKWIKEWRDNHFRIAAIPGSKGFSFVRASFAKPLTAVFALCGAMLLLACLNLASLLMARAATRERELATRLALGASRRRLMQQLMTESLIIAIFGTAAGLLAAPLVSQSLTGFLLGKSLGAALDTTLDFRVLSFVTVIAIVATLLIGLLPALRATSSNLNEQIKSGSQSISARNRNHLLPRIFLSLEVALALILVVGAGLLATSLNRLYRTGLGFEPKGVATLSLNMTKQSLSGDPLLHWYQNYGEALGHQPGVASLSFASMTPMDGSVSTGTYKTSLSGGEQQLFLNTVGPAFFETMRIPLIAGREFQWTDTLASGHKVIISESAAKTLFPNRNALGLQFTGGNNTVYTVIGIAGDIRSVSINQQAGSVAGYFPITQDPDTKASYDVVMRVNGSAEPLAIAARKLTSQTAPDIPAPVFETLSTQLDDSLSSERMMAMLSIFFAAIALLVTGIGLYGTLAYATARRTSEIGIRMALGAQRTQVVAMVFRENAWSAAAGSIAGLVLALFACRALASFLYGTSPHDPWVMIASVAMLIVIASAASLIPALRAARIDPMQALRTE